MDRLARLTEGDIEVTQKRKSTKKQMKKTCSAVASIMCYQILLLNDARPTMTVVLKNA